MKLQPLPHFSFHPQSRIHFQNYGLYTNAKGMQYTAFFLYGQAPASKGKICGKDNVVVPRDADFSLLGKVNILHLRRYNVVSCF
jgi:hypothetical protein